MNSSLQCSSLTRLLTLNNQVHDLENQLLRETLPPRWRGVSTSLEEGESSRIAAMQEEIDRGVRASLTTCWLGMSGGFQDE
ncbi:MAG: hypothetical protein AAB528_04885 [Chloroflexota bacterium]